MNRIGLIALSMIFVMLWSSGWIASHYAVASSSALSVLTIRYLIMFVTLLIVVTTLRQWRRVNHQDLACHLLIGALCHAIYLLGSISAFELGVTAAVVAFISSLQPVVTAMLAGSVTGECVQARHCKGVLLGVLSTVLIVSESYSGGASVFALSLPFLAMVAIAMGTVLNRRQVLLAQRSERKPLPISLLMLIHSLGALIVIVPLATTRGQIQWQYSAPEWFAILWLALVVSLCAYALLLILLRHLSAIRVSSFTYLVPPVTMLQGFLIFGDTFTFSDAMALILAIIAVYLVMSQSSKSTEPKPTYPGSAYIARHRLMVLRQARSALDFKP